MIRLRDMGKGCRVIALCRRCLGLLAVQVFLAFFAAAPAHAHAILIESTPSDNAVLKTAPREATLRFNARIEKGVSRFTLLDEKGVKFFLHPQPEDGRPGRPDSITIALPGIGPGTYRLQYLVLATDGHSTPGIIRFTVSGGAPR